MKKISLVVILLMLSIVSFAQKEVTKFLGIPVDGTKQEMEQKLKNKGFVQINGLPGLSGEFNGKDVFVLRRIYEEGKGPIVVPLCYDKSLDTINQNCSKTGNGDCCAEKIRRASWEIDKSYPW